MANYNVNMKQFNGTDYDGLLPLAYNALNSQQLAGKTYDEIQNLFTPIYSGSYYGTGTYRADNYISMPFTFEPLFVYAPIISGQTPLQNRNFIATKYITTTPQSITIGTYSVQIYFKDSTRTELRLYSTSSANNQFNNQSIIYTYLGIGRYDWGNGAPVEPPLTTTEWLIKYSDGASGTWTVPRSGYYQLELYGGGGASAGANGEYALSGASCQTYDSIYLIIGEKFSYTIGAANAQIKYSDSDMIGGDGGNTTFGKYSVKGTNGTVGYFDVNIGSATEGHFVMTTKGSRQGNKGKDGYYTRDVGTRVQIIGSGSYSSILGIGGSVPTSGGIYIKYLHD